MTDLSELLAPERIDLDFEAKDREGVLKRLAHLLGGTDHVVREAIEDDLFAREQMATTAVGSGVAFPHARVDSLPKIRLAFLRTRNPVPFGSVDGRGVELFVAVAGPKQERRGYLAVLSKLSYLFRAATARREFRQATSSERVEELFREARTPRGL